MPDYLVRDRDRLYGEALTRRIRAMGIRNKTDSATIAVAERLC